MIQTRKRKTTPSAAMPMIPPPTKALIPPPLIPPPITAAIPPPLVPPAPGVALIPPPITAVIPTVLLPVILPAAIPGAMPPALANVVIAPLAQPGNPVFQGGINPMDMEDKELVDAKTFFHCFTKDFLTSKSTSITGQNHRLTVTPTQCVKVDQILVFPRAVDPNNFDTVIAALETLMHVTGCQANSAIFTARLIWTGYRVADNNFPEILPESIPQETVFLKSDFPVVFTLSHYAIQIMDVVKKIFICDGFTVNHYDAVLYCHQARPQLRIQLYHQRQQSQHTQTEMWKQ